MTCSAFPAGLPWLYRSPNLSVTLIARPDACNEVAADGWAVFYYRIIVHVKWINHYKSLTKTLV